MAMMLGTAALLPLACRQPSPSVDSRQIVLTPVPTQTPDSSASSPTDPASGDTPEPTPSAPGRTPPPTPEPARQANLWIEVLVDDTPGAIRIQALSATDLSIDWILEAPGTMADVRTGTMRPDAETGLATVLVEGMYPGVATASVTLISSQGTLGTTTATASLASGRNNVLRLGMIASGSLSVDLRQDLPWPTPDIRMTVRP
ncbi:MAG: hypothetical protein VKP57_02550 [Candidatus Sericytochromatia bacterium]|nr:hypothetical protein [Candidatus Sericytochromatia bacterium]